MLTFCESWNGSTKKIVVHSFSSSFCMLRLINADNTKVIVSGNTLRFYAMDGSGFLRQWASSPIQYEWHPIDADKVVWISGSSLMYYSYTSKRSKS